MKNHILNVILLSKFKIYKTVVIKANEFLREIISVKYF